MKENYRYKKINIDNEETAGTLHEKLMELGGNLLLKSINKIFKKKYILKVQRLTKMIKKLQKLIKNFVK